MTERDNHESALNGPATQLDGQPPPPRPRSLSLSERVQSLRLPDQKSAGGSGGGKLPWTLCLLFGLGMVVAGYYGYTRDIAAKEAEQKAEQADDAKPRGAGDLAGAAMAAVGDVVLESKGYIIPAHQILVSPKVGGMVEKLSIVEGQRVKKGDILAQLEAIEYQADSDRAVAMLHTAKKRLEELEAGNRPEEIKAARAELDEAIAQRDQLYNEYNRNRVLQSSRTVAERDFEHAEGQYKAMERRVERLRHTYDLMVKGPRQERIEMAKAEVKQAEADLVKARWRLDNCTVKAPVTGTILKKSAEEGNLVNAIAFNGSFALCEMADLSDLEVELSIQERDIARVFAGQKCKVRAEAFPKREYDGVVSRLMPIADRAKGAVPVRVKLTVPRQEEGMFLRPEMGAVVSFLKSENPKADGTK